MELNQYVTDAIRTESRIEAVKVNKETLIAVLKAYVAVGNLLDDLKKNIFYNKQVDSYKWAQQKNTIQNQLGDIMSNIDGLRVDTMTFDPRLFHAIVGIATESTELVEAILTSIDNEVDIDHVNVKEELGDLNWYQAIAVDASEADWDDILSTNIEKLRKRYPEKFTSEHAINRNLEAERKILEGDKPNVRETDR
ncbi:MAG: hypothetical protein CTY12_01440 [Methylotenera sp.]|nr:MAG: hypothetical protein CTY12_01440 [Methylotenera sp.]